MTDPIRDKLEEIALQPATVSVSPNSQSVTNVSPSELLKLRKELRAEDMMESDDVVGFKSLKIIPPGAF